MAKEWFIDCDKCESKFNPRNSKSGIFDGAEGINHYCPSCTAKLQRVINQINNSNFDWSLLEE